MSQSDSNQSNCLLTNLEKKYQNSFFHILDAKDARLSKEGGILLIAFFLDTLLNL